MCESCQYTRVYLGITMGLHISVELIFINNFIYSCPRHVTVSGNGVSSHTSGCFPQPCLLPAWRNDTCSHHSHGESNHYPAWTHRDHHICHVTARSREILGATQCSCFLYPVVSSGAISYLTRMIIKACVACPKQLLEESKRGLRHST